MEIDFKKLQKIIHQTIGKSISFSMSADQFVLVSKTPLELTFQITFQLKNRELVVPVHASFDPRQNTLMIESDLDKPLTLQVQDLSLLLGVKKLGTTISNSIPGLDQLGIDLMRFEMDVASSSFSAATMVFTSTKKWPLLEKRITLDQLKLQLRISNISGKPIVSVSVGGDLNLGKITLQGSVLLPEREVCAYLKKDETLPVKTLLNSALAGTDLSIPMPALTCNDLFIQGDLQESQYYWRVGIANDWPVNFLGAKLLLSQVVLKINLTLGPKKKIAARLEGEFNVNGIRFSALLEYQAKNNAWRLLAVMQQGNGISVSQVLHLVSRGKVKLPALVPDFLLSAANFSLTTKPFDFSLSGQSDSIWKGLPGGFTISLLTFDLDSRQGVFNWNIGGAIALGDDQITTTTEVSEKGVVIKGRYFPQSPVPLGDVAKHFLPSDFIIPETMVNMEVIEGITTIDTGNKAFHFSLKTKSQIVFGNTGMLTANEINLSFAAPKGQSTPKWTISVAGTLSTKANIIDAPLKLQGLLTVEHTGQGNTLSFESLNPKTNAPQSIPYTFKVPIELPKPCPIALEAQFQRVSIGEVKKGTVLDWEFDIKGKLQVRGLETIADNALYKATLAGWKQCTLSLSKDSTSLSISPVTNGLQSFKIPDIPWAIKRLKKLRDFLPPVKLGTLVYRIDSITIALGEAVCMTCVVDIGLPKEANNIFGYKSKKKQRYKLFKVYDSKDPVHTLIKASFLLGSKDFSLKLLTSPFNDLHYVHEDGTPWNGPRVETPDENPYLLLQDKEVGTLLVQVPELAYQLEPTAGFYANCEVIRKGPLQVPTGWFVDSLAPHFKGKGMGKITRFIPQKLPLTDEALSPKTVIDLVKKAPIKDSQVKKDREQFINLIQQGYDKFPDRFANYFNLEVPERLGGSIKLTMDGSFCFDVNVDLPPQGSDPHKSGFYANEKTKGFKILTADPLCDEIPALLGIQFRGISLGELDSGTFFLFKFDADFDIFPLSSLVAAVALDANNPSTVQTYGLNTKALQCTASVVNPVFLIEYESEVPVVFPITVEHLGLTYKPLTGGAVTADFGIQTPGFNLLEAIGNAGQLIGYWTTADGRMDTSDTARETDLTFEVAPNQLTLPHYLGGEVIGWDTPRTLSSFRSVAYLMNFIKFGNTADLVKSIPADYRKNNVDFSFLFFNFQGGWILSDQQDFLSSDFKRLGIDKADKAFAESSLPIAPTDSSQNGTVVALQGQEALSEWLNVKGYFSFMYAGIRGLDTGICLHADGGQVLSLTVQGTLEVNPSQDSSFPLQVKASTSQQRVACVAVMGTELAECTVKAAQDKLLIQGNINVPQFAFDLKTIDVPGATFSLSDLGGNASFSGEVTLSLTSKSVGMKVQGVLQIGTKQLRITIPQYTLTQERSTDMVSLLQTEIKQQAPDLFKELWASFKSWVTTDGPGWTVGAPPDFKSWALNAATLHFNTVGIPFHCDIPACTLPDKHGPFPGFRLDSDFKGSADIHWKGGKGSFTLSGTYACFNHDCSFELIDMKITNLNDIPVLIAQTVKAQWSQKPFIPDFTADGVIGVFISTVGDTLVHYQAIGRVFQARSVSLDEAIKTVASALHLPPAVEKPQLAIEIGSGMGEQTYDVLSSMFSHFSGNTDSKSIWHCLTRKDGTFRLSLSDAQRTISEVLKYHNTDSNIKSVFNCIVSQQGLEGAANALLDRFPAGQAIGHFITLAGDTLAHYQTIGKAFKSRHTSLDNAVQAVANASGLPRSVTTAQLAIEIGYGMGAPTYDIMTFVFKYMPKQYWSIWLCLTRPDGTFKYSQDEAQRTISEVLKHNNTEAIIHSVFECITYKQGDSQAYKALVNHLSAEKAGKYFRAQFKMSQADIARVFRNASQSGTQAIKAVEAAYSISSDDDAQAIKDAGYGPYEIAVALRDGLGQSDSDIGNKLHNLGFRDGDLGGHSDSFVHDVRNVMSSKQGGGGGGGGHHGPPKLRNPKGLK